MVTPRYSLNPLAFWLFRQTTKALAWSARQAWNHRTEIATTARVTAKVGVAAGRVAAKGVRRVYEHRDEIRQVTVGACRGGAAAVSHCVAPFTMRDRVKAEYDAVREQASAYERLVDRRQALLARGRARRETLLDCMLVGGQSLASFGAANSVPHQVRLAYELAYPQVAAARSFADQVRSLDTDQLTGFASGVKGKLFELKLLQELNQGGLPAGYTAALAKSANQPGWDISIHGPDGELARTLQAKAADSVEYVRHALERYPHIDVVTTHEVAGHLAMLSLGDHVLDSGMSDAALERVVHQAIDAQAIHMDFMPSVLLLGLIAYSAFRGTGSLADRGRAFGERGTKSWAATVVGGSAAVLTQTWWMAIPAAIGARALMGSGERLTRELRALQELRKANDRVLERMRRINP